MFKIDKKGKGGKRQKNAFNKLPDSVRILGVFFDPQLYFNDHLKITLDKVEKKLHCLLKLAYCKHYRFKPNTIYKLFESVIRPKLEYALCTTSSKNRMKEIEKVQKRALRIALQVKKQTPTWKLMEIVNGKSMTDKLKELQIKMWHKYKRAPDYLLQHWTFKQWKDYIEFCCSVLGPPTISTYDSLFDHSSQLLIILLLFCHIRHKLLCR